MPNTNHCIGRFYNISTILLLLLVTFPRLYTALFIGLRVQFISIFFVGEVYESSLSDEKKLPKKKGAPISQHAQQFILRPSFAKLINYKPTHNPNQPNPQVRIVAIYLVLCMYVRTLSSTRYSDDAVASMFRPLRTVLFSSGT